jgi:sensor histidine kinase YesM
MICEPGPILPKTTPSVSPSRASTLFLLRALWIVAGSTFLIVLLFLSTGKIRLQETGREVFGSFVYAAFIGLPSIVLLTWVSHRYTGRYPRLIILMQALILVCTATAGCFGAGLVFQIVGMIPRRAYWREFWASFPFSIVISLAIGLSISTYETLRYRLQAATLELRTKQVEQERAYKLLAEARLSSLESRIHPHFLFNTLNSIAALIPSDPARAEATVGKLASLLRFSLNAHPSGLVPLSQELKIVRDYLEIEKTRFGPRLGYEIAVPETFADVRIPPLALQSLVENSVKHVVAQRALPATIRVEGSMESGQMRIEVVDDGPGFSLDAITPEHGLGNLIARLDLLFGEAGQLNVTRADNRTVVRLSFPGQLG